MPYTVADSSPSERYPIWSRGNVGEVYPNPLTPLTGTLIGEAASAGQRQASLDMGIVTERDLHGEERVGTGVFGGYLYANLSLMRLFGVRMPGMSVADVDVQVVGQSVAAPPYVPRRGDRNLGATMRALRRMGRRLWQANLDDVAAARRETDRWRASIPEPTSQTDDELVRLVQSYPPRFADAMRRLLFISGFAGAGGAAMERFAEQAGAPPGTAQLLTAGLGTIDSAAPAVRLWDLGRLVARSARLTELFDARADPQDGAGHPDVDGFVRSFDEFLRLHGARGPDEWELASSTWGTDPVIALAAVERLRHAPDDRSPHRASERLAQERAEATTSVRAALPRPARPVFAKLLTSAAVYAEGRERAKAIFMDDVFPIRRALFELASRVAAKGGPADRFDTFMVTADELPVLIAEPSSLTAVIAERRALWDDLNRREPPFVFVGEIPDPATWSLRTEVGSREPATTLQGMGVCPGRAEGTVRVVRNPADPSALEPGDVLVAPITDPAWTPLFLAVAAVVVEVGAQQSHAAIVARELGIPAVVGVTDATTRLRDGQRVAVDGATGTITVLDAT